MDEDKGRRRAEVAWRRLGFGVPGLLLMWLGMAAPFGAAFSWITIVLGLSLAIGSVLHATRSFDEAAPHRTVALGDVARPLGFTALGLVAAWFSLRLATRGSLGGHATWIVPTCFLGLLAAFGRLLDALSTGRSPRRPFHLRGGFWVTALTTLLLLPTLGTHSLIDPWETHYGEVSREILSRRDWISLWWANDGWFFSKPILLFWLQAGSMSLFGVDHAPGKMLEASSGSAFAQPEWAIRFPIFVFALLTAYAVYRAIGAVFGRRAGLCAAVVLTTMPQWSLVSHQAMTDLPFVAAMTISIAFLVLGMRRSAEEETRDDRSFGVAVGARTFTFSLRQAVLSIALALVLPQIVYLFSRNVGFAVGPDGSLRAPLLAVGADTFSSGSPGNCGVWPGVAPCEAMTAAYPRVQPIVLAALFAVGLAILVALIVREQRRSRLLLLAATLAAAVSTLAKGPAGIVFPVVVVLCAAFVTRRWKLFLDLDIPRAVLALVIVVSPWFVAMFVRHGAQFTDRLLFHDMFKRAFEHVHDTNQETDVSFRYYLWQLGYGCLPWLVVLPGALARVDWRQGESRARDRTLVLQLLMLWAVSAFALFSYMQTKFHHYILPAVPPLACLVGIELARLSKKPRLDVAAAGWLGVGCVLLALVTRDVVNDDVTPNDARFLHLFSYDYRRSWPSSLDFATPFVVLASIVGLATAFFAHRRSRRFTGLATSAAAAVFAAFLLFVYLPRAGRHYGQRELVVRYLEARREAKGSLIAYQMNWKGENFYTGGELAIFVDSGKSFRDWVAERKKRGERIFYVLVPTPRLKGLRTELRTARELEVLTNPEFHDKFSLVRVRY